MCGIFGAISVDGGDICELLLKGLKIILHRGPDGSGIATDNGASFGRLDEIKCVSSELGIGANRLTIVGNGYQPIRNEDGSLWIAVNGEVYNYQQLMADLRKRGHRFNTDIDVEILLHLFEESRRFSGAVADYAVLILDLKEGGIWAFRDRFGIRPLYIGRGKGIVAFASERKALKGLEVERVKPGEIIFASSDGVSKERLEEIEIVRISSEEEAVKVLREAIVESVLVRAYRSFAILFSGGLDSSIIAKISKDHGLDAVLITVGREGSKDLSNAREAARALKMQLEEVVVNDQEIVEVFRRMPSIIDESDALKAMIGVPIYLATKRAKELGLKVAMTGQGADELFCGYAKYLEAENPAEEMLKDFKNIHVNNLERDDHCAMANSVELRPPYLDEKVVSIALGIPVELKIRNGVRKYILRRVALELGLPKCVAMREKKAVQYGSGTATVLRKEARKRGVRIRDLLGM